MLRTCGIPQRTYTITTSKRRIYLTAKEAVGGVRPYIRSRPQRMISEKIDLKNNGSGPSRDTTSFSIPNLFNSGIELGIPCHGLPLDGSILDITCKIFISLIQRFISD